MKDSDYVSVEVSSVSFNFYLISYSTQITSLISWIEKSERSWLWQLVYNNFLQPKSQSLGFSKKVQRTHTVDSNFTLDPQENSLRADPAPHRHLRFASADRKIPPVFSLFIVASFSLSLLHRVVSIGNSVPLCVPRNILSSLLRASSIRHPRNVRCCCLRFSCWEKWLFMDGTVLWIDACHCERIILVE